MDIHYTHNGTDITLSVPVTANAVHEEELMKSDHIRLSFDGAEGIEFPLDAYIIPFSDGVRYSLLEPYSPEQKNEEQWHYEPLFQHPKMYLGKVPFVFPTKDSDNKDITQLEWDYTGFVGTLLEYFCEQINNALGLTGNDKFTYSIVGKIEDIVSTTFSSVDILSGLSDIANKLNCEYHLDWPMKTLYFGHIILNTQGIEKPMLEVGVNVGSPSVRSSKDGYWNAFEPQGSTRNISKKAATGENVQSTVRLSLREYTEGGTEKYPDGIVYTDGKGNVITKSEFEQSGMSLHLKSLIFDNVYPKLDLYVYDVRSRERYLLDENNHKVIDHYEDGEPIYKRYSIWYMRLAYPTYNQQGEVTAWTDYTIDPQTQIIDGKELYGAFQPNTKTNAESSPLAGRGNGDDGNYGFALNYHTQGEVIPANVEEGDSGVVIKAGDYEIVFQQSGDLILPTTEDGGIVPKGEETPSLLGNIVNLYNIVMDSSFTQSAQNELENETKKEIANIVRDNNSYTLKSYPDAFEGKDENLQDRNPHLYIGQGVTYKNGGYTLETRVMKLVTNLDYDFVQEITIGNEVIKGATTTLKEQVQSILTGGAGNGGGVDENAVRRIIKAFSDARYLSKINDDVAQGFLTLVKGLQVGNQFVSGLLGEGGVFRKEVDGTTYLEADKMYIRMKAYFDTVVVREYRHSEGNRVASVAGVKCVRVAWFNSSNVELEQTQANLSSVAYFRCYFRASDGEDTVRNNFVVGDQVYCHITDVASTDNPSQKGLSQKHYWRLCVGRNTEGVLTEDGEAYIDISNRSTETISGHNYTGFQTGSDVPTAQDSMIQLGNVNDVTRQGAIIEFVTGANAPSYQIYQGINNFSLSGKNMISLGYNSQTGHADLKVYGDAYIGDPNGSTFIEYKQDDGTEAHAPKLRIKAEVEFTNSDEDLDNFVQSHQRNDSYDDTEVRGLINGLQDQIDGQVESWFFDYPPVHVDAQGAPDSKVPLNVAPYSEWTDDNAKIAHLGDTFTDNSTGYCWRFTRNENNNAFEWTVIEDSAIISALQNAARAQDTADHKRRVFLSQPVPPYDAGDMWVNAVYPANYTGVTDEANHNYNNDILKCVTAKASDGSFSINDWALASKYTDDSKFNGYISALLNNTGISGDSAAAAVQNAILGALGVGTVVAGGLLLTSLIGMRQYNGSGDKSDVSNYTTWAGISGQYNANVLGGGMAAWYGGGMLDKETLTTEQISQGWSTLRWAKGVDRFDGSGYRADGNISWNENGALTIKNITTLSDSNNNNILNELATFNSAFTFGTSGEGSTTALYITPQVPFKELYIGTSNANKQEVATKNWVNQNFVTTTFFDNLFRVYNGAESASNKIAVNGNLPSDTANLNIEAMFGFWTKKYISALGQGDDGSTSYTTLAQLNDVSLSNPTANQVLSYNGTHWVNKSIELGSQTLADLTDVLITSPAANQMLGYDATNQKWINVNVPETYTLPAASTTALGGIKIGYSGTTAKTYAVVLDSGNKAYVSVPWENTWTAWVGATSTAAGTAGYMPAPTSAQRNQFLRGDGTWVSLNNYSLPTASADTLGGVKIGTTLAISSGVLNLPTTGVTAGTYKRVTVDAYGRVTSGDNSDTDTNTWRNIYVGGTSKVGTGIDTKAINFKAGSNVSLSFSAAGTGSGQSGNANYFDVVISATDTTYSAATQSAAGLMSAADKKKLDGIAANANNYSLPLAASGTRGGVQIGYSETNSGTSTDRNYAVQLSSEKMFVNVPWENTWRGIQNNLTSQSTTDSLSAYQGYLLANGSAMDSSKLPLTGGTLTGTLTARDVVVQSAYTLKIGDAILKWDSSNNALKLYKLSGSSEVAVNFYATGGVSALGMSEDGSAGAGDVTWALLASSSDTRQIALSHLTTALGSYATQSWVDGHFGYTTSGKNYAVKLDANGNAYVNVPWEAGSGTVTSVKVGTTSYTPTNGVISLPAYPTVPTKVSQLTNDSGYITSYTDTKNTAGTTNKAATKLYIVGAESQAANPQTYSNVNVYIGTDNCLYSNNTKVLTSHQSVTNKGATLSWGSAVTVATIGSTDIKVSLPANPNTNTTYKFTIGSTTKGDATNGVDLGTLKSETAASGGTTLSLVTTGEKYSWNNKTYTTSIATDSGTNQLTLAFGTKYKLTAGGTSFVFTMPSNPDTDVNVKVNNTNPTTGTWYYPVWYTATNGTGNVNANDGFRYYSLQGTASALGESYLQIGNSTASGTAGNKRGHLRIYGNKAYYGEFNMVDDLTANKTYTFSDDGTVLTSGNSSVSLSGQTLTVKINGVSKSLTNSTYTLAGLMGLTAKGSTTQPIYWNGTAFANTTYTLGKSVPSDAVFTDHYAWSDITGKPLTLTKNTTGFSISGGTTSKTLTVGADYTLGAACAKGVTDNSSNADVTSSDTNLITGRTLYYQLAKKGYTTNTGTVTSVATGTGLTGGTITTSGTISINSTYQTYISHGESAYGWGNHANANYMTKGAFASSDSQIEGWGALSDSSYTPLLRLNTAKVSDDYGCAYFAYKNYGTKDTRVSMQVDGYFYQNEGQYRVLDTSDASGLSVNYANSSYSSSYSTYATYLNASYSNGGTTWTWNPLNQTQYYAWGQQFKNTNVSTDTADMRFYIAANNTSAGGLCLWLNLDGGINAMTSLYAGEYVQVGNIKMVYDSTNNAIKVIKADGTAANFYATGGVSALGAGQESGGGGGDVTWALLASAATGGRTIHSSYISSALSNYLPLSGGTLSGSLEIFSSSPSTQGYCEGIRLHPYYVSSTNLYWSGITFCGSDNSGNGGTSANTWGIYNNDGKFYLNRNASSSNTTYMLCNDNGNWKMGTATTYNAGAKLTIYNNNYPHIYLRRGDGNEASIYITNPSSYAWAIGQSVWENTVGYGFGIGEFAVNGAVFFYINTSGQCVATRGISNSSDMRLKNRIKDIDLSIEQIANAPAFTYKWKDAKTDTDLHAGTSAQYWQSVLPEIVTVANDNMHTLSMQYGVAALISAISIAKKVVKHEEKIALLETRVSALEKENGEQEQLINSLQEELAKFKAA